MGNLFITEVCCDHKIILNFWEESDKERGITQDGCSLHLHDYDRKEYINEIYSERTDSIPDSYERPTGDFGYYAYVTDNIYNKIIEEKVIRLSQVELKNLISLEEIIIEYI